MIDDERSAQGWIEALPECDSVALSRLERLIALLSDENNRQNLVSASSLGAIWRRHIADSAQLLSYVPRGTSGKWLDLGTGAGFPGLVIAILRPELPIHLSESRARRAQWLENAATALGLANVSVRASRLELIQTEHVSVISARAFAPLERLLELSARLSTAETIWLLPKGRSAAQELRELTGWDHLFYVEQSLTDPEAGLIVGRLNGKARQGT